MKYKICEETLSSTRLGKYASACRNNKNKTILLYQYNLKLSQRVYGVIGLFEVMLRNAINKHYTIQFKDENWIIHQACKGRLLEKDAYAIQEIENGFRKRGIYTNDKMVASFTMGFWTYLFTRNNYRAGGKTLLNIFPDRIHGLMQRDVYKELTYIREFRNRIAHYEPICFDHSGNVSTDFIYRHYDLIRKYIGFMGLPVDSAFGFIEKPDPIIKKINDFKL